jgi:hypothetical protein
MRLRIRIQPYRSPELQRRPTAFAAAQGVTESVIAEAAAHPRSKFFLVALEGETECDRRT